MISSLTFTDFVLITSLIISMLFSIMHGDLKTFLGIIITIILMVLIVTSQLFRVFLISLLILKFLGFGNLKFSINKKDQEKTSSVCDQSSDIDAIVEATSDMAENNVGALIIVAEEDGNDIGKFGTSINADISRELLENIFVPNTPLHDGAVVVTENGRISTAGSVIPLSEGDDDKSLPKDAGTRHRAALSASKEDNVGVCVLVSEERGDISIAIDGIIYSGLSKEKLRDMLVEHTSLTNK